MRRITRREFISHGAKVSGIALGGLALGRNLISPPNALGSTIDFLESSCQANRPPKKKILVAYASFCGSTGGVAEAIGRELCAQGAQVDIRLVKKIREIDHYDGLVLGSSIRQGAWLPEAKAFALKNQQKLSGIPVAYFLTCLTLYRETDENRKIARSYLNPVLESAPSIHPIDLGLFAGALDFSKLSVIYRMVMKSKAKKKGIPEGGDFRNWEAIRAWARGLGSPLLA